MPCQAEIWEVKLVPFWAFWCLFASLRPSYLCSSVNEPNGMFLWQHCSRILGVQELHVLEAWWDGSVKYKTWENTRCTVQCQESPNLGACDTGAESTANGSFGSGGKICRWCSYWKRCNQLEIRIKINGTISNLPSLAHTHQADFPLLCIFHCLLTLQGFVMSLRSESRFSSAEDKIRIFISLVEGFTFLPFSLFGNRSGQSFILGGIRADICREVETGCYWERKWLLPGPAARAFSPFNN